MKKLLFCTLTMLAANTAHAVRNTTPVKGIQFNHSQPFAYNGSMALLVGAGANPNPINASLSVALLAPGFAADGTKNASFIPLAIDPLLQGVSVQDLTISGSNLVVAVKDASKNNSVYMIEDTIAGTALASPILNDAAGNGITNGVVALAGAHSYAFALVGQTGKAFDDASATDRGVAVLERKIGPAGTAVASQAAPETPSQLNLVQLNALDFAATENLASARLDVSTTPQLFSFIGSDAKNPIAHALVGPSASMVWDEKLQRLYVGLSDVSRDSVTKEGGCLSLAMGLLDRQANAGTSPALRFVPIVKNVQKSLFYVNNGYAANYAAAVQLAYELFGLAQQINDRGGDASGNLTKVFADPAVEPVASYIARVKKGLLVSSGGKSSDPIEDVFKVISQAVSDNSTNASTKLQGIKSTAKDLIKKYRTLAQQSSTGTHSTIAQNEYVNGVNNIFGFYYDGTTSQQTQNNVQQALNDGNDAISVSANKLCVMHTSTNRTYLILESVIANNPVSNRGLLLDEAQDWVYALPLIDTAIDGDQETVGSIPWVDNKTGVPVLNKGSFQVPQAYTDMPLATHPAVKVAQSNPIPGAWVDKLFVVGDSVYMGLVGPNTSQRGMYKSTALFGEKGFIVGWTPAERVMGFIADVFAGGMNTQTGDFYAVTDGGTTGRVTDWGLGDPVLHGGSADNLLSTVLSAQFAQELGGVHQLIPFDKSCSAFSGKVAISVALGRNGIALIQTGAQGPQGFVPTTSYALGTTVKLIPLSQLAPLTSAAFVFDETNASLIVSGFKGMVKLNFNGVITSVLQDFSQKNITQAPILKVAASSDGFYAMGLTNVYKYSKAGVLNLTTPLANGTDMVVVGDKAIVAAGSAISALPGSSLVTLPGRILNMSYLCAMNKELPTAPGNLYILVQGPLLAPDATGKIIASTRQTATQVYRYGLLKDTSLSIIPLDLDANGKVIPYLQFNDPRTLITADGSLLFNSLPKDTGISDFVRLLPITPLQPFSAMLSNEYRLYNDLQLNGAQNFNVSTISRDPSSGAWMVPGDWGIRVNE